MCMALQEQSLHITLANHRIHCRKPARNPLPPPPLPRCPLLAAFELTAVVIVDNSATALTTALGGQSRQQTYSVRTYDAHHQPHTFSSDSSWTDAARAPRNTTLEHLLFPGVRNITKRSGSTKDYLCGGKFTLDTLQCKAILGCMVRVDGSSFWDGRGSLFRTT